MAAPDGMMPAASAGSLEYSTGEALPVQCKLAIGAVDDPMELEAEAMADRVMRMPDTPVHSQADSDGNSTAPQTTFVQRKCAQCEEEKVQRQPLTPFVQRQAEGNAHAGGALSASIQAAQGNGFTMDTTTLGFMESRFATDFSSVKIHTGREAEGFSRQLNAQAFTVGNDIYFNSGKYNPASAEGKHLLAHELTHTLQQSAGTVSRKIQRQVHNGHDNYAGYAFDDASCELSYNQHWYFDFQVPLSTAEKTNLMNQAASQVHQLWSNKYPLKPTPFGARTTCPCSVDGVALSVNVIPREGEKQGRGIRVTVRPSLRANVNPVNGNMELEHNSSTSDIRGTQYPTGLQYTVAHEFGHTIDITDEYAGWTGFFSPSTQADTPSMMNSGNDVRPRHYQYFADLISRDILGCRYNPNGIRMPEWENPVFRTSTLSGLTASQDGLTYPSVTSALDPGANFDFRTSNERVMGILYPQAGMIRFANPATSQTQIGATAGLRLGQIAHPLVFNLRTGIVFNPANPGASLGIPLSITAGIRTSSFELGVGYTPVFSVLTPGQVSHLLGAGITF
ncbi:uncharacterized protein DUF4157 [Taibaiella chishuiensis]|uniref:Uncharacterized protein DUF4157 n=2 Tax=Taibaiella chishuiensis TaxID=1434707 RepID=A0A2P8D882_9BACT|nr:uncharacterized protein DUF4157 [Taibaiella chishuiensis]